MEINAPSVPSICQSGVIVLWKRSRRTEADSEIECPGVGLDLIVQKFAVARVGFRPGVIVA